MSATQNVLSRSVSLSLHIDQNPAILILALFILNHFIQNVNVDLNMKSNVCKPNLAYLQINLSTKWNVGKACKHISLVTAELKYDKYNSIHGDTLRFTTHGYSFLSRLLFAGIYQHAISAQACCWQYVNMR